MNQLVHHLPQASLDALASLIGMRILARVVRGGMGDSGLTADKVHLAAWPASVPYLSPGSIERVLVLSGTIESPVWVAIAVEEITDPDLVELGVAADAAGRLVWADGFSIHPSPRALVTSVTVSEETFTIDVEDTSVSADCRIDIVFDRGQPLCFEVGAAGVGFYYIHRTLTDWAGADSRHAHVRESLTINPTQIH